MNYQKINNILGWGVGIAATIVYAMTMEPTVSFWDCGEFISGSLKMEVVHPPGAPLFLFIDIDPAAPAAASAAASSAAAPVGPVGTISYPDFRYEVSARWHIPPSLMADKKPATSQALKNAATAAITAEEEGAAEATASRRAIPERLPSEFSPTCYIGSILRTGHSILGFRSPFVDFRDPSKILQGYGNPDILHGLDILMKLLQDCGLHKIMLEALTMNKEKLIAFLRKSLRYGIAPTITSASQYDAANSIDTEQSRKQILIGLEEFLQDITKYGRPYLDYPLTAALLPHEQKTLIRSPLIARLKTFPSYLTSTPEENTELLDILAAPTYFDGVINLSVIKIGCGIGIGCIYFFGESTEDILDSPAAATSSSEGEGAAAEAEDTPSPAATSSSAAEGATAGEDAAERTPVFKAPAGRVLIAAYREVDASSPTGFTIKEKFRIYEQERRKDNEISLGWCIILANLLKSEGRGNTGAGPSTIVVKGTVMFSGGNVISVTADGFTRLNSSQFKKYVKYCVDHDDASIQKLVEAIKSFLDPIQPMACDPEDLFGEIIVTMTFDISMYLSLIAYGRIILSDSTKTRDAPHLNLMALWNLALLKAQEDLFDLAIFINHYDRAVLNYTTMRKILKFTYEKRFCVASEVFACLPSLDAALSIGEFIPKMPSSGADAANPYARLSDLLIDFESQTKASATYDRYIANVASCKEIEKALIRQRKKLEDADSIDSAIAEIIAKYGLLVRTYRPTDDSPITEDMLAICILKMLSNPSSEDVPDEPVDDSEGNITLQSFLGKFENSSEKVIQRLHRVGTELTNTGIKTMATCLPLSNLLVKGYTTPSFIVLQSVAAEIDSAELEKIIEELNKQNVNSEFIASFLWEDQEALNKDTADEIKDQLEGRTLALLVNDGRGNCGFLTYLRKTKDTVYGGDDRIDTPDGRDDIAMELRGELADIINKFLNPTEAPAHIDAAVQDILHLINQAMMQIDGESEEDFAARTKSAVSPQSAGESDLAFALRKYKTALWRHYLSEITDSHQFLLAEVNRDIAADGIKRTIDTLTPEEYIAILGRNRYYYLVDAEMVKFYQSKRFKLTILGEGHNGPYKMVHEVAGAEEVIIVHRGVHYNAACDLAAVDDNIFSDEVQLEDTVWGVQEDDASLAGADKLAKRYGFGDNASVDGSVDGSAGNADNAEDDSEPPGLLEPGEEFPNAASASAANLSSSKIGRFAKAMLVKSLGGGGNRFIWQITVFDTAEVYELNHKDDAEEGAGYTKAKINSLIETDTKLEFNRMFGDMIKKKLGGGQSKKSRRSKRNGTRQSKQSKQSRQSKHTKRNTVGRLLSRKLKRSDLHRSHRRPRPSSKTAQRHTQRRSKSNK